MIRLLSANSIPQHSYTLVFTMSSGSSGDESTDSRKFKIKGKKDKKDKDKKHEKKDKDKKDKDKKGKDKDKDKKDKDKKDKKEGEHSNVAGSFQEFQQQLAPVQHAPEHQSYGQFSSPPIVPPSFDPHPPPLYHDAPPTVASVRDAATPPSGYRVPLTTTAAFPDPDQAGQPPCYDVDGSPIFIGSALFDKSVQPCKIGPHLSPFASVAFGGFEHGHHGRYDLLPFVPQTMEFVPASHGRIPPGRRPIEGGYEEGTKLYHAVASINGVRVPGKTGEHL